MKNTKISLPKSLATLFFSICAVHAHAGIVGAAGKITRIATGWGGEGFYISIDSTLSTNCPTNTSTYIAVGAVQYKEVVSIAVAAQAQGKQVTLYYDNSTCPQGNVPTLLSIGMPY